MRRRALLLAPALLACGPRRPAWGPDAYPSGLGYGGPTRAPGVTMYMTSWCPVCRRARAWLQSIGEPFVEYDVEQDDAATRSFLSLNPRGSVPTFVIGGRVYVGFNRAVLHPAIVALHR